MTDLDLALFPMSRAPLPSSIVRWGLRDAHWCEDAGLLLSFAAARGEPPEAAGDGAPRHHRLSVRLDMPGASAGERAGYRYVVWTDCLEGWDAELRRWYAEEHLPGLAAVPGTVRARRFELARAGPRHFACYDLTGPEVMGSQPWLDVRATSWSSRVRPNFRNARRWMCRTLTDERIAE